MLSQEQVRQALTDGNPVRMSQEFSGDASSVSGDESDVTDLMSTHVFRKPNARKVYLRNMVLLETEYQDILRYVLMILASVDKIVAYVQENLSALREVISGLSLGPAEYDLRHRNRGYGPVVTVIQENSFSASLRIFALTSYGMITWIVVLAATQKIKDVVCYPRVCYPRNGSRTRKKKLKRKSSSSRKMVKSMLCCFAYRFIPTYRQRQRWREDCSSFLNYKIEMWKQCKRSCSVLQSRVLPAVSKLAHFHRQLQILVALCMIPRQRPSLELKQLWSHTQIVLVQLNFASW